MYSTELVSTCAESHKIHVTTYTCGFVPVRHGFGNFFWYNPCENYRITGETHVPSNWKPIETFGITCELSLGRWWHIATCGNCFPTCDILKVKNLNHT